MIDALIGIGSIVFVVGLFAITLHAMVTWDGKKNCDHDCEHCPFPPCEDE